MKILENYWHKERPTKEHLASIIKEMFDDNQKITITKVAKIADATRYMIRWYFTDDIKQEVVLLNDIIKQNNQISKAIEAIDILTEGGSELKMRELKKLTSIRDYKVLKNAVAKYEEFT